MNSNPSPPAAATTVELLKKECNRYVNGVCHTRKCLVRGGYTPGGRVGYDDSTCEYHEAIIAIKQRDELILFLNEFAKDLNQIIKRYELLRHKLEQMSRYGRSKQV